MRLLLDTHALLWWFVGSRRLSAAARAAVADPENRTFVSAVSAYEISLKATRGLLDGGSAITSDLARAVRQEGFAALELSLEDAERAGRLDDHVRDPFDRLLIAQALAGDFTIVSKERAFDRYGVTRLW